MQLCDQITIDPVPRRPILTGWAMEPAVTRDRVQRMIVGPSSRTIAAYGIDHDAARGSEITYGTFAALWWPPFLFA
jgi:hypothetical protein